MFYALDLTIFSLFYRKVLQESICPLCQAEVPESMRLHLRYKCEKLPKKKWKTGKSSINEKINNENKQDIKMTLSEKCSYCHEMIFHWKIEKHQKKCKSEKDKVEFENVVRGLKIEQEIDIEENLAKIKQEVNSNKLQDMANLPSSEPAETLMCVTSNTNKNQDMKCESLPSEKDQVKSKGK